MSGLVDWPVARRVAAAVAGAGSDAGTAERRFGQDAVERACAEARAAVCAYTGLAISADLPEGESIGRGEWTVVALESLRELAAPIDRRAAESIDLPGPIGVLARRLAGAASGAEAGGAIGMAGRRVLGQLDVALGPTKRAPRLLFVAPNLAGAHRELGRDPDAFLGWIATHEVTHAAQFAGVPWLRDYLAGELGSLLDAAADGIEARRVASALRDVITSDPRRTVSRLLRGEAMLALAGREQRARLDRLQAAMTLVEGYAEHVMDAADPDRSAERAALREGLTARRESRGGLGEAVARMLGLELKLRQYRLGKSFSDAVVAEHGIDGLNHAWSEPAALPSAVELERPERWFARVAAPVV